MRVLLARCRFYLLLRNATGRCSSAAGCRVFIRFGVLFRMGKTGVHTCFLHRLGGMPEPRRRFVLTGGKFLAAPQRGVRRLRTAGTLRCPPRGQKGRDTCGFPSSLNSYLSLIRTARRQSESGDRFGIGERQSGYSCVGTRITRPLLDLYAVLRCRSATHTGNSTQTRHKVNCPKGKRRSPGG